MSGIITDNQGRSSGLVKAAGGGKIKQMAYTTYDAIYSFSNSNLAEVNTGNRVTITPTSTSNKLILEAYIPCNFSGTTSMRAYMWYDVTGSAVFAPSSVTSGSRNKAHTMFRGSGGDGNDCDFIYIRTIGACPRTTSSVFTPYVSGQSSYAYYMNYSNDDGSDWQANCVSVMTATEIETV